MKEEILYQKVTNSVDKVNPQLPFMFSSPLKHRSLKQLLSLLADRAPVFNKEKRNQRRIPKSRDI